MIEGGKDDFTDSGRAKKMEEMRKNRRRLGFRLADLIQSVTPRLLYVFDDTYALAYLARIMNTGIFGGDWKRGGLRRRKKEALESVDCRGQ